MAISNRGNFLKVRYIYTNTKAKGVTLRNPDVEIPHFGDTDNGARAFVRIGGRTVSGSLFVDYFGGFTHVFIAEGLNASLVPGYQWRAA